MARRVRIRADEAQRVPRYVVAGAVLGMCLTPTLAFADGNVEVTLTRRSVRIVGDASDNDVDLVFNPDTGELSITGAESTTVNDGSDTIVGIGRRDIVVDMGAGNDDIDLDGGAPRNLRVQLGDGNDFMFIDNGDYEGSVRVDQGTGNGGTFLLNSFVRGRTLILGGDDFDSLNVANCELKGPLTINGREGDDGLQVSQCVARRGVKLIGGDGNDFFFPGGTTYMRPTTLVCGDGDDQILFGKSSDSVFSGSLRILGGPGNDSLDGTDGVDLQGGATLVLGDGDDSVGMTGFNATRAVRILGGGGNDNVDLSDCFFDSSFSMIGGAGDEFCSFRSGNVGGGSRLIGGPGSDQLYNNVPVGRGLTIVGGGDDDTLGIGVGGTGRTVLSAGRGDDEFDGGSGLDFDGGLIIFNGGPGEDTLFNGPQEGAGNTYAREPIVRGIEEEILD